MNAPSPRRLLRRVAIPVMVLAELTGCASGERTAPTTVARSAVLPSDIHPVQFPVKCQGRSFTLLGFPVSDGSIPAFLSSTGNEVKPASFRIVTTVTDREGIVVFKRVDESPENASPTSPVQACSFTLYTVDDHGNTFTGRGRATAAFATVG